MFTYKIKTKTLTGVPVIYRVEDKTWIPTSDEANVDYQQYLKWIENGNTPGVWEDEQ